MPGGDRTGPRGEGQMTGGGFGYCTGGTTPGSMNPARGFRGQGRKFLRFDNRGGRRGHRNMYYATGLFSWQRSGIPETTKNQDIPDMADPGLVNSLKRQIDYLEDVIDGLKSRLNVLEKNRK